MRKLNTGSVIRLSASLLSTASMWSRHGWQSTIKSKAQWWDAKGEAKKLLAGIHGKETVCLHGEHKLIIALQSKAAGTPVEWPAQLMRQCFKSLSETVRVYFECLRIHVKIPDLQVEFRLIVHQEF